MPLLILPDVFNPTLFLTTRVLSEFIERHVVRPGMKVLDMGTGSGAMAILAARAGAEVVAVDISAEAVRCARINALLNRVETRVDVRQGDLFSAVDGERFDLVMFNPPYYSGEPSDLWEISWKSNDVLDRFARGLPGVLGDSGYAVLVLSSETVAAPGLARSHGMTEHVALHRDLASERIEVVEWRPQAERIPG